jgi:hypothetical protein
VRSLPALDSRSVPTEKTRTGKTIFILYALLRRLEHCLPTAIQFTEEYFVLFDENGAWKYPSSLYYHRVIPSGSWALVNSGYRLTAPGPALFSKDTVLVQTTSPAPRRWKEWKKQHSAKIYVMQLWDLEEIEILLYVFHVADVFPD